MQPAGAREVTYHYGIKGFAPFQGGGNPPATSIAALKQGGIDSSVAMFWHNPPESLASISLLGLAKIRLHRRQKSRDRDRLGKVGLAAALADALLVPLHGECRDRDHRDGAEVVILLDPLGHL